MKSCKASSVEALRTFGGALKGNMSSTDHVLVYPRLGLDFFKRPRMTVLSQLNAAAKIVPEKLEVLSIAIVIELNTTTSTFIDETWMGNQWTVPKILMKKPCGRN